MPLLVVSHQLLFNKAALLVICCKLRVSMTAAGNLPIKMYNYLICQSHISLKKEKGKGRTGF